ncbi:MAG: DUF4105 domain-containing protein [Lysobacterales bacterium]
MRWGKTVRFQPIVFAATLALSLLALGNAHATEPQTRAQPIVESTSGDLLEDVPDARIESGLLTIAPGAIYWQRFGHNAIVLRDRENPSRIVAVNYGIFDFGEKNFLLNFLRGRMHYFAVAGDPRAELLDYAASGRGIGVQWLALTPRQISLLRGRLQYDVSPAQTRYRYDYFTRNCSTRVRDALDIAFSGALERSAKVRSRGWTYRQQSLRLARPDLPLALGIHLGLAGFTDSPLTLWQEAFVPQRLADAVADLQLDGKPAVVRNEQLARHRIGLPKERPPQWRWVFVSAGLAMAALLWMLGRVRAPVAHRLFNALRGVLLALCGLIGCGLLALWLGTDHIAAHRNLNILVMSPLCLLWLFAARSRHPNVRRLGHLAIGGVLASLAAALWFAFTEAAQQDFADWLLLMAPALLVLARAERAISAQES